jgi:hypothetical protein
MPLAQHDPSRAAASPRTAPPGASPRPAFGVPTLSKGEGNGSAAAVAQGDSPLLPLEKGAGGMRPRRGRPEHTELSYCYKHF